MNSKREYKNLEDLSDSDEEIHPNIDSKSYRKFIKEQRSMRFQHLKSKENLTIEEQKEMEKLEYMSLPVVKEVSENNFRISKENENTLEDYSEDLGILINLFTVEFFLNHLDRKQINLNTFEELVDINLIEYIKSEDDDIGLILCKIGLCTKWLREFGRNFLIKLGQNEEKLDFAVKEHYQLAKKSILELSKE